MEVRLKNWLLEAQLIKENLTIVDLNLDIKIWSAIIITKCSTLRLIVLN